MGKNKGIVISIKEIKERSFYLKPLPMPIGEIQLGDNLLLGLGFTFDVDFENNLFIFKTLIKYEIKDIDEPVLELVNEIIFEIQNLEEVVKTDDEGMEIEDDFLITLAGVAIGTSRGILAANTKGSHWAKFPLPILNPKEVIDEMNAGK